MANVTSIIEYYANLLIIQYHNKPKAAATVALYIDELLASGIYFDIRDAYSVDTAVGAQLDIIGKYVGLDRFYQGQLFEGYFSLLPYLNVAAPPAEFIGFTDYALFETKEGKFLNYDNVISQTFSLGDTDFRFLIKLRIIQNHSNHSHKSIDDSMHAFFGALVRPDSAGSMTMVYFVDPSRISLFTVALQKGVIPKPMGVRLLYTIPQSQPFFAFTDYSEISLDALRITADSDFRITADGSERETPIIADAGFSEFKTGFTDYAGYDTKLGNSLTYSNLLA